MIPLFILILDNHDDRQMMISLYEDNKKLMYTVALSSTGNEDDAEDVVHDTWLSLCSESSLATLRRLSHKDSHEMNKFLARCVLNKSTSFLRKKIRQSSRETMWENVETTKSMDHEIDSRLLIEDEVKQCIAAIESLPTMQRKYLEMRFQEDLSYKEIATLLGKSVDSIRSQVSDALKNLKRKVAERMASNAN